MMIVKRRRLTQLIAMFSTLCAAGCTTLHGPERSPAPSPIGSVGADDVTNQLHQDNRLTLPANETFIAPFDDENNGLPRYPSVLLNHPVPPRTICVQVAVGRNGLVTGIEPFSQPPKCPSAEAAEHAFVDEIKSVVAHWKFDPALRCVYPNAAAKEVTYGNCGDSKDVNAIPAAVSLVYRFSFEQRAGRGVVHIEH